MRLQFQEHFIYDLTHLITQEMPVYPGDPQPEFKSIAAIEKQKVNVTV
jgi:kynurenine formamidase